jgi:hypothetical protein
MFAFLETLSLRPFSLSRVRVSRRNAVATPVRLYARRNAIHTSEGMPRQRRGAVIAPPIESIIAEDNELQHMTGQATPQRSERLPYPRRNAMAAGRSHDANLIE